MSDINLLFSENFPQKTNGYNTLMKVMELNNMPNLSREEKEKLELYTKGYLEESKTFISDINMVYNLMKSIKMDKLIEYSKHSVIKELFQNIFDCNYTNKNFVDINISVVDKCSIKFKYNEDGFTDNAILKYLYIGNSDKSENVKHVGRFGIGAKFGIFKNTKNVNVESQNSQVHYSFSISNNDNIRLDSFTRKEQKSNETYTQITLTFGEDVYNKILEEFKNLILEKGRYVNIFELFFAAQNSYERTKIKVFQLNINNMEYKININDDLISLDENSKHILGMLSYKSNKSNFIYLIPKTRGRDNEDIPKIIYESKCNYFSTYELTGDSNSMTAFYISVPSNGYVTPDRKALAINDEKIKDIIAEDLGDIVRKIVKDDFYYEFESVYKVNWTYIFRFIYEFIGDKYGIINNIKFFVNNLRLKINGSIRELSNIDIYRCDYDSYADVKNNIDYFLAESNKAKLFYKCSDTYKKQKDYVRYDVITIDFLYYFKEEKKEYSFQLWDDRSNHISVFLSKVFNYYNFEAINNSNGYKKLKLNKFCKEIKILDDLIELNDLISKNNEYKLIFNGDKKELTLKLEEQDKILNINELKVDNALKIKDIFLKLQIEKGSGKEELKCFIIEQFNKYLKHLKIHEILLLFKFEDMKIDFKIYIDKFEVCDLFNHTKEISFIDKIGNIIKINDTSYKQQLLSREFFRNNKIVISKFETKQIVEQNKIIRFLNPDGRENEELIRAFERIHFYKSSLFSGKTIAVFYNDEGVISDITEIKEYGDIKDSRDVRDNVLVLTNQQDNTLACYIEKWISGENNSILKKVIEHKNKVVLLDQIAYSYKFPSKINKNEFDLLIEEANKINKDNIKEKLIKDVTAKLFGYGYNCCIQVKQEGRDRFECNYQGNSHEPFMIQEIEYNKLQNNKTLTLPAFVCANDYYDMKSWIVTNITFAGETMTEKFNKLEELVKEEHFEIDTSFFNCTIEYEYKISYSSLDISNITEDENNMISNKADIVLTPLNFAIWFNRYSKIIS